MKKIKEILLILLLIFGFQSVVQADMGAPSITSYQIRIKDVSGSYIYKNDQYGSKIKIPYDTILEVKFEHNVDGVLYGEVEYDNSSYFIRLADVELVSNNIDLSNWVKDTRKMYVYKEGAYLYNGPSKVYGKVEGNIELPVGTTITFDYHDEMWAYVNYNGTKGWVYIYSYNNNSPYNEISSLAEIAEKNDNTIYTFKNITLLKSPESNETTITIPPLTKLTYKYYYNSDPHIPYYYFEYNGQGGWYMDTNFSIGKKLDDVTVYTLENVKLYENLDNNSKVLSIIPSNKEIKVIYEALDTSYYPLGWLNVEYNNTTGWIQYDDSAEPQVSLLSNNLFRENYSIYKVLVNSVIYDNIYGNKTDDLIAESTQVNVIYDYDGWYYVKSENVSGWINSEDQNLQYLDEPGKNLGSNEILENDESSNEIDSKEEINKENTEEKLPKLTIKEISIYCICGALILALTAFVTIQLINKKRKVKENSSINDNDNIGN